MDSTINYVIRRLGGDKVKASARKAGFKNGRPSTRAREVEEAAKSFLGAGVWPTEEEANKARNEARAALIKRTRQLEAVIALNLAKKGAGDA